MVKGYTNVRPPYQSGNMAVPPGPNLTNSIIIIDLYIHL